MLNADHLRRSYPLSRLSLFVLAGSMLGACSPRERGYRPLPEASPEQSEPGCDDEIRNGTETDVDCGGVCQRCLYGKTCKTNTDCRGGVCEGSICAPRTRVFSAMGTTDACCEGPAAYKTIPEMSLEVDLDGDYVVLTEFDINVVGGDACWVAMRLAVDGTPDPSWTAVQPWGGPDEDDHVHLFRIDPLQAGAHRIQAEWGSDSCKMCNTSGTGGPWVRKISAIAIPTSTGVTFGYKHGTGDACTTSAPGVFTQIADLSLDFDLSGPSIVLSQFDINWVGSINSWTAARMVLDGNVDPRWTHTQPQGGNDEDDHVHLARLDFAQEGHHNIVAQWGDGHDTMCNPMAQGSIWDRRIGYLTIPLSTGASFGYAVGSTDACRDAGAFETVPDMSLQRFVSKESIALTHFDINWVGCDGCWSGARLATDGVAESHWTHTQPQGGSDEDDHVHMHRVDVVAKGLHTFAAEWGDGNGKMCNNASAPFWSRRIGTLLLPVAP